MTPLFKKLNFKQQAEICILQHPLEFQNELYAMKEFTDVKTDLDEYISKGPGFILTFLKSRKEIDRLVPVIDSNLKGDSIIWFALWFRKKTI
ncbi:MAG: hypothetical protein JJU37_04045 [Balneolaceae bacterium]|nr:hypothetical protein [Balneolaceae bacterium]